MSTPPSSQHFSDLNDLRIAAAASFADLLPEYSGSKAANYERKRTGRKWCAENKAIARLLATVPPGTRTLDVPVGTARFLNFYKARKFNVVGVDASVDMISQAQLAAHSTAAEITLVEGDILALPFEHREFELIVCIRFLNLIGWSGVQSVVKELARVCGGRLIIGVRLFAAPGNRGRGPLALLRSVVRATGLPVLRARRRRQVVHSEQDLLTQFSELGLDILHKCYVERRWDGTDYLIFMLQAASVTRKLH